MLVELFCLILGVFLYYFVKDNWLRSEKLPPGPIRFPIIGNLGQLIKLGRIPPFSRLELMAEKYGQLMGLQFGHVYQVVVHDLEQTKEILCSEIWVNRYWDDYFAERSFGKSLGVIFISGDVHKEMRRFSMRTLRDFGFGKQKSMEAFLSEEIVDLFQIVDTKLEKGLKQSICMQQFFAVSVLNILWTMLAGYRFSHDNERLHELISLINEMSKANPIGDNLVMALPKLRPLFRFSKSDKTRTHFINQMHNFFTTILHERRAEGAYKDEQRDFIDVFLKEIDDKKGSAEPNHYTDEQFIMVCFDLFVAGADTTSNTMEFAILYMILNPHVQKKVQAEIDRVIGFGRMPTIADKPQLPYTEATLLEVQRLANVLPIVARGNTEATKIGGFDIPKDSVAVMNLWHIHHSESIWEKPREFNPERFLDSHSNIVNTHKILPFGMGKRACLGETLARASLFTFFTCFLQKYTIEQSPNHSTLSTEPLVGFTMSPKPYHVMLKAR